MSIVHPFIPKYLVQYPYYLITRQRVLQFKNYFEKMQWLPYEELVIKQQEKLRQKLYFAYNNIPFYKKRFDMNNIHPGEITRQEDLLQIPVLTKEDIINNFQDFSCSFKRKKGFVRQTSGSSGLPLCITKDNTSMAVMDAIMYRNYSWFNIEIGERQARYWGSPLSGKKKTAVEFKDLLLNRIRFSPFDISEEACKDFLTRLYTFKPAYIYGYGQTISKFSEYVVSQDIDLSHLKLKAVIVTGEMTSWNQMLTIEKAFQCKVADEYGCTEAGIIAMECPNKGMHLMAENLFIEFVKDGRYASPGEEGEIIITELYGDLMPLIRYKVGDIGSYGGTLCRCGRGLPLLGKLKGRNDEFIVCSDGRQVDPIIFEYVLKEIPPDYGVITAFRIIQENDLRLDIDVCYQGDRFAMMVDTIVNKMKKVTGREMKIDLKLRDSIPAEPSGKLRCFISRMKG